MSGKHTTRTSSDTLEWTVKQENVLLWAMTGHKPVGVNRHFMMAFLHDRFSKSLNKQISSKQIWEHLDTMYDMATLHESEIIPFPDQDIDFELQEDFDDLAMERLGVTLPHSEKQFDAKANSQKPGKKSSSNKMKPNVSSSCGKITSESNSGKSTFSAGPSTSVKGNKVLPKSELSSETSEVSSTKVKTESLGVGKNAKNKRSVPNTDIKSKQEALPQAKVQALSDLHMKKTKSEAPLKKVTKDGKSSDSLESAKKSKDINVTKTESPFTPKKVSKDAKMDSTESSTKKTKDSNATKQENQSKKVTKDGKLESNESTKKSKEVNPSLKKTKHTPGAESSGSRRSSKVESPVAKKKHESEVTAEKNVGMSKDKMESKRGENESESQHSTGYSKASRSSVKADQGESRKRKSVRTEELTPSKKTSVSPAKRRRL